MRKAASAARLVLLCGCASLLLTGPGAAQQSSREPAVTYPTSFQVTAPLSSVPPASAAPTTGQMPLEIPLHALPQGQTVPGSEHASDRAAQTNAAQVLEAQPQANFLGITQDGYIPPDPNIAVSFDNLTGTGYIVEMVNSEIAIYDRSGVINPPSLASGYPKKLSDFWGNTCGNSGDPVVQYDRLATNYDGGTGAWVITQLQSLKSPYGECIAVSKGADPGGGYFLYFYSFGNNLNDYPKFGVWPTASNSAYLGTYNLFANGSSFVGADLCAYDRAAMLSGAASPAQVCFPQSANADGGFLPSDLDGGTAPTESGLFLAFNASTKNSLTLYQLTTLDFANPANSRLSSATEITGVMPFSPACNGGTCIPQASTKKKLDSLGDRLMYRLAYRVFKSGPQMVVTHSVKSSYGTVAPQWYLLSETGPGQFVVAQQGTHAPDAAYRWMGSIAMDQSGDILLGYSKSSSTSYPSIAVAGRIPSDPVGDGNLEGEFVLKAGGGAQTMYSRWGDYTAMRIDPADDCTFWYVNEYLPKTSFGNWYTWIDSRSFNRCGPTTAQ